MIYTIRRAIPKKTRIHSDKNRDCCICHTEISHEEGDFIVDPCASMHMLSKSDLIHEDKGNNSKIEKSLYDHQSKWNNHDDRRRCCLRQRFGRGDCSSIIGKFTRCILAKNILRRNIGIPTNGRTTITHINQGLKTIYCKSENCTDSRTWRYCRRESPKRCKYSIEGPTADSFGRARARYSRLASAIQGRTGLVIQSTQNTSFTYFSQTQTQTGFKNTAHKSSRIPLLEMP